MHSYQIQKGGALLEVLITIIILAVGLLGLASLQLRLQESAMESYQRSQALVLLNDMANRVTTNRNFASSYVTSTPLGADATCPTATSNQLQRDLAEWCNSLQGAGEMSGSSKLGAMIGGRGCVESLGSGQYMITVAWQGLVGIAAPPASVSCGLNGYNSSVTGSSCVNDLCRRAVTKVVSIASLI